MNQLNKYGTSRTTAGQTAQELLDARAKQLDLLKTVQITSPTLKPPQAGDMAKYVTKAGNVIDVDVLKNMPDGKIQVQGPNGQKFVVDEDLVRAFTSAQPKPKMSEKALRFLGLVGNAVGKMNPALFAATSQANVRSGYYGDMDPSVATGIEFLAAGGDILDLVNYLPDKALEGLGLDFRFGKDAGGKSRQSIKNFLGSQYIPPNIRTAIFGGQDPQKPKPKKPTVLTSEQSMAMLPAADYPPNWGGAVYIDRRDQSTQQTNVSKTDKIAPTMTPAAVDALHNRFLMMYSGWRIGGKQF
jgi:hypothetical protein